jgi:hypothetical protein
MIHLRIKLSQSLSALGINSHLRLIIHLGRSANEAPCAPEFLLTQSRHGMVHKDERNIASRQKKSDL